jgi:cbb3-type cytochrome oxidase maturation protein
VSVIYVLLPVAVLIAAGALVLFIRSVQRGQFDDLDTPAVRMLHDDEGRDSRDRESTEDRPDPEARGGNGGGAPS